IAGTGGIAINAAINGLNSADATKNADLTLTSVGGITEGAAGTISVNTIAATATKGDINLNNAGNSIFNFGDIITGSTTILANNPYSITIVNNRAIRITRGLSLATNNQHNSSGNINLTAAGDITQTGGINGSTIHTAGTGLLNLTATGNITLDNGANNYFYKLGRISANAINIRGAFALTITDSVTANNGDITLIGPNGLTLNAAVTAANHNVNLKNLGNTDLVQSAAGIITANTLNIQMNSSYTGYFIYLDNAQNNITNLGNITYKNELDQALSSTTANISIANATTLAVTGTITPTTGILSLTAATGNITQTAAIKASQLKATATNGDVILTNVNNIISNLGASNAKNISVTNSNALNIAGNVTVQGGALNLVTVSGNVTQTPLTEQIQDPAHPSDATKKITQNIANAITAPTVNVTAGSGGAISLGNIKNNITTLGNLIYGASADLTLGTSGILSINQNITTTGNVTLNSGGGIATTASAKITAATLRGSAAGAVNLNTSVTNLGNFTVTGTGNVFTLTNDKALNISGAVT
ncbi:MAG: hypothetical protein ORN98_01530, partial [Alphaproteobacteria bacterium]|nr:hypothetical protein [Alphaproteobacteria bacterium]